MDRIGRCTQCRSGEALSQPRGTRNGSPTLRSNRLGEMTILPGPTRNHRAICTGDRYQVTAGGGYRSLARLKACDPPWVLTAGTADIRRAGVLTAGTTGGSEPPRILTTGVTNIAQSGLSLGHSASGPSKAIAGAAADSAVTSQPTEGHRAKEAKTRRLGARGDYEIETDDSAADASCWQAGPRPDHTTGTKWLYGARPGQAVTPRLKH